MSRLRVAFDARRLQDRPLGGVGRAYASVIDLLASEVDLVLLTDARRAPVDSRFEQQALRPPPRAPELVWLQWNVPRWLRGFDGVFHGTFSQLPFRIAVPAVVTIADLTFELHHEGYSPAKRRVFQMQARHAARVARHVITPSEATKADLVACYRLDPERISIIPFRVEPRFDPAAARDAPGLCARLGVTRRYIVAMGGAPRRGLEVAVDAWRRVRDTCNVDLIVVGAEKPPVEPGLAYAGVVGDAEWAALLAGAAAFCYPTRFEGFGVPAVESMASGTPVVCAPVKSLPEVLGDAAEWCESPTGDAVAAALRRVLDDPGHAGVLRRRGLERTATQPRWEEAAEVLLRAYDKAYRA